MEVEITSGRWEGEGLGLGWFQAFFVIFVCTIFKIL